MKVLIWVKKADVVSGKITDYYIFGPPQTTNWPDYVQVEITRDEFVRLEDERAENRESDKWNLEQYNRNREFSDQIDDIKDSELMEDEHMAKVIRDYTHEEEEEEDEYDDDYLDEDDY